MKKKSLQQRDRNVIWHPYTQEQNAMPPLPVVKAEGSRLFLEDGTTLLDGISSWWVNPFGHGHEHLIRKVKEQAEVLDQVIFAGFTHEPAVKLAEMLLSFFEGNLSRAFYSDNGSTAVEVALKMAIQFWHNQGISKQKIIAFEHAYHGDTFGAMSVSGRSVFNAPFEDFLFGVHFIPAPVPGAESASLMALKTALESGEAAAFIYEPLVQGAGGMLMHAAQALEPLLTLCRQHEVLLIADEVMTGFGRTGFNFASDSMQVKPDIICLSKGITGGMMALGATLCTERIYEAFLSEDRSRTLFHGHSYTANPLACAAGIAACEILARPETQENIRRVSAKQRAFAERIRGLNGFEEARHCGTIFAVNLSAAEATAYLHSLKDRVYAYFLSHGILLRPLGNILYVLPPYCISDEELMYIYGKIALLPGYLQPSP